MTNHFVTFICTRTSNLFKVDTRDTNILLAIISLLTGLGFIFGSLNNNSNYIAIQALAPAYIWAIAFIIHGIHKTLEEFYSVPIFSRVINSLVGMWLWNYIVLSFIVFDSSLSLPFEYTLITPIIIEVWYLTSLAYLVEMQKGDLCTQTQL